MAIALLLLPWVIVLVLVRRHHHLDGETVGILVAVSLGLPTLWVAWAAYRGPRRGSTPGSVLSMAQVADQLAVAVGAQWAAEATVRRLTTPIRYRSLGSGRRVPDRLLVLAREARD